jgi:Uma2 family endonuclease
MSRARIEVPTGLRLSREAYHEWAASQSRGRYERHDGYVVAMAPERLSHVWRKATVWSVLDRAVAANGLPCQVYPDGVTIEIGDSDYEPDVTLRCGAALDGDRVDILDPLVVVAVLSPATRHIDLGKKLVEYFKVATLRHYLMFDAILPQAIHHQRSAEGEGISTQIISGGDIRLDPPGLTITIEEIYAG